MPLYIIHTDLRLHTTLRECLLEAIHTHYEWNKQKQYTRVMNRISRTTVINQLNIFSYKNFVRCESKVRLQSLMI